MRGMGDNLEHIDTKDVEVTAKIILKIVDSIIKENNVQMDALITENLYETDPLIPILNINSNTVNNNAVFSLFVFKILNLNSIISTKILEDLSNQQTSYPITKTAENTATTSANDISLSSTSKTSTDTPTYPTDTISALNNQESAPATTKDVTSETAASETISSILQPINTIRTIIPNPTTPAITNTNIETTTTKETIIISQPSNTINPNPSTTTISIDTFMNQIINTNKKTTALTDI
jgi:hypothetical protein